MTDRLFIGSMVINVERTKFLQQLQDEFVLAMWHYECGFDLYLNSLNDKAALPAIAASNRHKYEKVEVLREAILSYLIEDITIKSCPPQTY